MLSKLLPVASRGLLVRKPPMQMMKVNHSQQGWFVRNYPVTYLIGLFTFGCCIMFGYTGYCILYNPDLHLHLWDKQSRRDYYKDHLWNDKLGGSADKRGPPVRMDLDGKLVWADERLKSDS